MLVRQHEHEWTKPSMCVLSLSLSERMRQCRTQVFPQTLCQLQPNMRITDVKTSEFTCRNTLTCRSLGRNVLQIACPQSMVRIQAVVFIFHIFNIPGRAINEWL